MKNAAFPDQMGGCEKSMHYPDDPLFWGMHPLTLVDAVDADLFRQYWFPHDLISEFFRFFLAHCRKLR